MNTNEFLSNEEEYEVETYTLKQVMELLDIKQKAVYNLASRGHIKALDFPYGKRTVYHYTRESVDYFLREKLKYITIPDLAEEFNVSKSAVFNCLQRNNISYELDDIHFPRKTAVVKLSQVDHIRRLLSETLEKKGSTVRKSDFYRNGYGLYQPFYDPNGNIVRLIIDKNNHFSEWGFFSKNFFIPLTRAIEDGYKPQYEILDLPTIRAPYAIFKAPSYDKNSRILIDIAYQNLGFRNMYIEQLNNEVRIYLKESAIPLPVIAKESLTLEWIKQANLEGNSTIIDGSLVIESGTQVSSYYLKSHVSKSIEDYATKHKLQPGEVIELAIKALLQANKEGGQ